MEATATKATFQKYSAYKDSGVEWLGKIPEHWEIGKLGTLLKPVSIKNRPDLPLLSITREAGVIERNIEDDSENHNFIPDDLSGYKVLNEGQFGMNKMKAWQGSYGIAPMTGIVSPAYYVFDFNSSINPRFFHLAIRSKNYVAFFGQASDGVRVGQWDLSKTRMKEIPFFIPPLPEQTAIAAFLDDKTAKIDRAIAQKEKMITLLKERKQIIIQNAVTKGLDPNAKMKHSGVEWIGEIPEGWEVLPGLRFFKENKRSNKGMKESTVLSLSYGNIIIKPEEKLVGLVPESFETYQIVYPGDIIIRCTDLQNDQTSLRTGLAQNKGIITSAYINLGIIGDNHPEYLHAYLHFVDITKVLYKFGSGLRQNLSFADFKRMPILKVPYNEQVQIVEFIQKASLKIERAIEMQHKEIEKLKELKSTLIDSAVTGKLRVPSVQEIKVS